MDRLRRLALLVLSCSAAACGAASGAELTVSAATSLANAFADIGRAFEAHEAGTRVLFNFAASGALLQQIAHGAPVDVLATADEETMDDASKRHLVDAATRIDFARNSLVVIVPSDARSVPASLADVAHLHRVAIGRPASVPAGRYARAALEAVGLWPTIGSNAIGAQSVRQVLDYVARGEVDAGFCYATDAAVMPDRVRVAFAVAAARPVVYPVAVSREAADPALAARFVRFVATDEAQAVLAHYGFARP